MKRQQGFSLLVVMAFGIVAAVVAVLALKVIPVYSEYRTLQNVLNELATSPDRTEYELRRAFLNHAIVHDITAVKPDQLLIAPGGGEKVGIGFRYDRDVPLIPNVKLVFHFEYQAGSIPVLATEQK